MYYVLDTNFIPVMVIEEYTSCLWVDRFDKAGEIEIETIPDEMFLKLCKQDYYIVNTASEHMMIIEGIRITTDAEEGARLYITGSSVESILKRRIIWNKTTITGNLQNGIKKLLTENIISPTIEDRKISNFIFKESTDPGITSLEYTNEYDKDNLYDVITDICKTKQIGFKITRNASNLFVFELYAGNNHSHEQTANSVVLFSPKMDNLKNSEYKSSIENSINVIYVIGGSNSDKSVVLGTTTGLLRRETYLNAGAKPNDYSGTENAFLTEKGNEQLNEEKEEKIFEGDVYTTGMFVLGEDFLLGDIVQIENEYTIRDTVRVKEIVYSDSNDSNTVYPTFEAYSPLVEEEENST